MAKNASFSLFWHIFVRKFFGDFLILAITQQIMIKAMKEASWSNDDEVMDLKNTGQFHAKRTRVGVTISKLIFLGQNMLVRPHEVD